MAGPHPRVALRRDSDRMQGAGRGCPTRIGGPAAGWAAGADSDAPSEPGAAELGWAVTRICSGGTTDSRWHCRGPASPEYGFVGPYVGLGRCEDRGHSGRRHCAARVGQQPPLRVAAAGPRGRAAASRAGAGPIAFAERAGSRRPCLIFGSLRLHRRASVACTDVPHCSASDCASSVLFTTHTKVLGKCRLIRTAPFYTVRE